jgi:hypothetical protein
MLVPQLPKEGGMMMLLRQKESVRSHFNKAIGQRLTQRREGAKKTENRWTDGVFVVVFESSRFMNPLRHGAFA